MLFTPSALSAALSALLLASSSALAAPAHSHSHALAARDQVIVAPDEVRISVAPVAMAERLPLAFSPSPASSLRSNPKITATLALQRGNARNPVVLTTTTTTVSSTSLTTRTTTSTSKVGTTTTRSTTTTKAVTTTTTKPAPTSSTSSSSAAPSASASYKPINAAYYADWTAGQIPPENINYSLFDILYFSFAIPAEDNSLYFTQWNSIDILKRLITNGHAKGTKVAITIGGWTGSKYFSTAVSTAANREQFAQNIADMVNLYKADGVDLDWEYPGQKGADGNIIDSQDSANFLIFLRLLRAKFGKDKIISLATPLNVWYGDTNAPMTDVREYAKVLDHVLLMNYDVWGASTNPGPNAPMNYCGDSWQPGSNAVNAVKNWKAAGMPARQIMLGVPAYGYISDSTATSLIHRRSRQMEAMEARKLAARSRANMLLGNTRPHLGGEASDSVEKRDIESRAADGDISSFKNSQMQFNQLISYKVISLGSTGIYYGRNGFTRKWDDCSSTPFLYNTASSTVVTYDDPVSLRIKGEFAREQGLAGTGMWDISGDTADYALVRATRAGLGI